ncbi:DUF4241 domain-containing protein [Mycobacterium sp. NPDC050853]|uniref:DUF4241 domain-containing protein n=1 Tax=Mycobacterium sp. NPDC050853 TaxID=3155160 RepID=UPI0033D10A3D
MDPSHFAPWARSRQSRNVELDRLALPSGRLAVRDVHYLDGPWVELTVPPGEHRVWSTELDIRSAVNGGDSLFRPAYLSVQLSDATPSRVSVADDLCHKASDPSGSATVDVDLGMVLLNDADSVSVGDMEALDESWEQAWENSEDYAEIYTAGGAKVITCKTVVERTRCPIVASYDASNQPVAIHIDFGVLGAAQASLRTSPSRVQRWGAVAGRTFPWLFRQR